MPSRRPPRSPHRTQPFLPPPAPAPPRPGHRRRRDRRRGARPPDCHPHVTRLHLPLPRPAGFVLIMTIFVLLCVPETKGVPIEELNEVIMQRVGGTRGRARRIGACLGLVAFSAGVGSARGRGVHAPGAAAQPPYVVWSEVFGRRGAAPQPGGGCTCCRAPERRPAPHTWAAHLPLPPPTHTHRPCLPPAALAVEPCDARRADGGAAAGLLQPVAHVGARGHPPRRQGCVRRRRGGGGGGAGGRRLFGAGPRRPPSPSRGCPMGGRPAKSPPPERGSAAQPKPSPATRSRGGGHAAPARAPARLGARPACLAALGDARLPSAAGARLRGQHCLKVPSARSAAPAARRRPPSDSPRHQAFVNPRAREAHCTAAARGVARRGGPLGRSAPLVIQAPPSTLTHPTMVTTPTPHLPPPGPF